MGFFDKVLILLRDYWSTFLTGVLTTLTIAIIGTIIGFCLGALLSSLKIIDYSPKDSPFAHLRKKVAHIFASIYITFFRGTPMIVQASVIYYGAMTLFGPWPAFLAGIVVVSLNTAAYIAEIIRAGVNSIDKGQFEASRCLGMSYTQMMMNVILPQAIKNSIPAVGNELIVNIKDTSVLSVISVSDLFFSGKGIIMKKYWDFEVYFIISIIYLILTITVSKILSKLNNRLEVKTNFGTSQTVPEAFIKESK